MRERIPATMCPCIVPKGRWRIACNVRHDMNGLDRRNQARLYMTATGIIHGRNVRVPCSTLDVCLRGMAVSTLERRDPGDFLRIGWSIGERDVEVDAVVVHAIRQACGTWLLGARFVRMGNDAQRTIFAYIKSQTVGSRALDLRKVPNRAAWALRSPASLLLHR